MACAYNLSMWGAGAEALLDKQLIESHSLEWDAVSKQKKKQRSDVLVYWVSPYEDFGKREIKWNVEVWKWGWDQVPLSWDVPLTSPLSSYTHGPQLCS